MVRILLPWAAFTISGSASLAVALTEMSTASALPAKVSDRASSTRFTAILTVWNPYWPSEGRNSSTCLSESGSSSL